MQQTDIHLPTFELEKWIDDYSKALLDRAYYLLSNKEDAKIRLSIHLSLCKLCQAYHSKAIFLDSILKKRHKNETCSCQFEKEEVERFKEKVKEKITG